MLLFPKNEHFVEDRGRSHQTTIIACAVATWSVAAAFVGMRFYTRRWLLNVIAAEDWVIVGALVFSAAESAGFIERESVFYAVDRVGRLGSHIREPRDSVRLRTAHERHI